MNRKVPPRDPSSYVVGYCKTPAATRFQPGQSGNPRGRPKGSRTVQAILTDILAQKIAITENGKVRRVSALEVMIRRLVNAAMQGDRRALSLVLAFNNQYGGSAETTIDMETLSAEDRAILAECLPETPDQPAPDESGDGTSPLPPSDGGRSNG